MRCCMLWFHRWGLWQDHKSIDLKRTEVEGFTFKTTTVDEGIMLIQARRCSRCKRVQLANIKTT